MITKTFYTIIFRALTFAIILIIAFGPSLSYAQVWTPPAGPPPNNNAPAPIHEGSRGQGKYWNPSLIPSFSLGSFLGIFEGVVSGWATADEEGIAAKQFCLMASDEALDYFPGTSQNSIQEGVDQGFLNCIDWSTGWGSTSTSNPGSGTANLPNGQMNGNVLVWRQDTNSWTSSPHFRQVSFMGNGFLSFVMGDWPDAIFSTIFGTPDASQGTAFGRFGLNGPFFYRPDNTNDISGDTGGTFGKILGGDFNENYRVKWFSPSDLGLVTQEQLQEIISTITTTITNVASLPSGTLTGQILYWSSTGWQLTQGVAVTGNLISLFDASLFVGTGSRFAFVNNEHCQEGSDGNVLNVMADESALSLGLQIFDVRCTGAIKIGQYFDESDEDTVVLTNVPYLSEQEIVTTEPRNLCYTTIDVAGVEKGLVIDCQARPTGTFTVNGPVPTTPFSANVQESNVEYWEIPFGVDSVTVRACAGGGGGGGGAPGSPGTLDKPGGGGGGGGAAGQCVIQELTLTEPNLTHLRITVGRGGRGGNAGMRSCPNGNQSDCGSEVGTIANPADAGQAGSITTIEKMSGSTPISTPITLSGGSGGQGGKSQCDISGTGFECGSFGGAGGKGGHVQFIPDDAQLPLAQQLQGGNGEHGREIDINNADTPTLNSFFYLAQYYAGFCNNTTSVNSISSCGGDGGDGKIAQFAHPELSTPYSGVYQNLALIGQGGEGGRGCSSCDNHFAEAWQGDEIGGEAYFGSWASGGGGGGGAYGWAWIDYNNGGGYEYRNYGGSGRRGGPGFVYLSW